MSKSSASGAGRTTYQAAHSKNAYGDAPKKGGGTRTGVARSLKAIRSLSKSKEPGAAGAKSFLGGYSKQRRDQKGRFA